NLIYGGAQTPPQFGFEVVGFDADFNETYFALISTPAAGSFTLANLPTPATYYIFGYGDLAGNGQFPAGTDPFGSIGQFGVFLDTNANLSGQNISLFDTGQISGGVTFQTPATNVDLVVEVSRGGVRENSQSYTIFGAQPGDTFGFDVGLLTPATDYSVLAFVSADRSDVLKPNDNVAVDP